MKVMKRLSAILMAAIMLIAMAFPAMAAGSGSIKITANGNSTDLSEKKFVLHRVLNATVDGDAVSYTVNEDYREALENTIKAVEGKDDYDFSDRDAIYNYIAALITSDGDSPEQKAEKESKLRLFADTLKVELKDSTAGAEYSADSNDVTIGGEGSFLIDNLEYGYYVVVESTGLASEDDGAISLTMLNSVTPSSEIDIKSDYPTIEKKVKDNNSGDLVDIADYEIGDAIDFTLSSAVPDMAGYSIYTFNFHDTLSQGLTYVPDSVKVKIGDIEYTKDSEYKPGSKVFTVDASGQTLSINLADLVDLKNTLNDDGNNVSKGTPIVVTYTAKLNENAVIGQDGNTNQAYIEYSNDPYASEKTGKTPEDKVVVFTYQIDVNKTNKAGEQLAGAEFKLFRTNTDGNLSDEVFFSKVEGSNEYIVDPDKNSVNTAVIASEEGKNIILKGLDSGTYYLKETKAPDGYNELKEPVEITITPKYAENQIWNSEITTDALTNLAGSIKGEWSGDVTVTSDVKTGKISFEVVNSTGVELPETGGMGTTFFYVAGFVIMAGAVTVFIFSRRKHNN